MMAWKKPFTVNEGSVWALLGVSWALLGVFGALLDAPGGLQKEENERLGAQELIWRLLDRMLERFCIILMPFSAFFK